MTNSDSFLDSLRLAKQNCSMCSVVFFATPVNQSGLCSSCKEAADKAKDGDRFLGQYKQYLNQWLVSIGMSPREASAELNLIPSSLKAKMMEERLGLNAILHGQLPNVGFGICGAAGTGKTFALAAIFKANVVARWESRARSEGNKVAKRYISWIRWPEVVNQLRVQSTTDGGLVEVQKKISAWAGNEVLVIDDIGAERLRGDYSEDWVSSQLDLVIDKRYNNLLPTWFTTNLAPEKFMIRYGGRLVSRLLAGTTLINHVGKEDLRLKDDRRS